MSHVTRQPVISSNAATKGAMIDETFAVFAAWNFAQTKRQNLDRLRNENFIGAKSSAWSRKVAGALNSRFEPEGRDRALVLFAKHGWDIESWRPVLLWHLTRHDFIVRDFLQNWLFAAYDAGTFRIRADELHPYLQDMGHRVAMKRPWSDVTKNRVATGLLKIAADFNLMRGKRIKEFASYHLPEDSFVYLLHAMRDELTSPAKVLASPDWRMFLMRPADVEHELLRLHQFRKLEYQAAGSLVELSLPCANGLAYAERMVA